MRPYWRRQQLCQRCGEFVYGDFEPVQDDRIEKNLFVATPAGACAYGGSSGDDGSDPYGNQWTNNRWEDGAVLPPAN